MSELVEDNGVGHRDRFQFSLFLALALHAAIILGISFSSELNQHDATSIEVTLAIASDDKAPETADFIASSNQIGSGTIDEVLETTTTDPADFQSNEYTPTYVEEDPAPQQLKDQETLLTTEEAQPDKVSLDPADPSELNNNPNPPNFKREQLIQEIASLEARIAQSQQALANRPRTKMLSQVSTRSAAEAAYLNAWRQKCERIGRVNYPPGQVEGEVLMLVSIMADGSLSEVRILKTSGIRALDQAAVATVRQAAPFQPFSNEMRKSYDVLEFTRTWQFTKSGNSLRGG